jgi:L-ribulose-5-phosphate 3-epimerase
MEKNYMGHLISRRSLMKTAAVAAAAGFGIRSASAQARTVPAITVFSKHLQFIEDFDELAEAYKDLGLDGCDLTVRPGGHIAPEDAAEKLPLAVEAFKRQGLEVLQITTTLTNAEDAMAEKTLAAASSQGIPYFRCGSHRYDLDKPIMEEVARITQELRGLAELAASYDMTGGYHNHSGPGYFGAPLWDLAHAFDALDSAHMGSNFDIGHATVEGSYGGWDINARRLAPYTKMMAVKDFVWTDQRRPQWVPYGEGRVDAVSIFRIMRGAGFTGPISLHIEYAASKEEILDHTRKAAVLLREQLAEAGYPA